MGRNRLRIVAIILLIGSLLTMGIAVQAYTPDTLPFFDPEQRHKWYVSYQANEISKPFYYWVLTDPDATILEAIRLSSIPEPVDPETGQVYEHMTEVRANETTFIYQVYEHGEVWEIEYEGNYYCVDCLYCYQYYDPETGAEILPIGYVIHNARHAKELVTGLAPVLSFAWIVLGFVWIKKKPEPAVAS